MNTEHIEKLPLKDRRIPCLDCGAIFTFTTGEQLFYWSKKLSDPRRCPDCRRERKRRLVPDPEASR